MVADEPTGGPSQEKRIAEKRREWERRITWREEQPPDYGSSLPEWARPEHREEAWKLVEGLLHRYERFYRVAHECECDGFWEIPFPGSLVYGENITFDMWDVPVPPELVKRVIAWSCKYCHLEDEDHDPAFLAAIFGEAANAASEWKPVDWTPIHVEGQALADEMAKLLGPTCYVEYDFDDFEKKVWNRRHLASPETLTRKNETAG